jgi:acetoin utilization deacetylase AcuC-like enzyme
MIVGFTTNPDHAAHDVEGHPECPERLESVLALLRESSLLDRLRPIEPRAATDEELSWLHPAGYIEALRQACANGGGWVDPDTYIVPGTCEAAWSAAGACLAATDAVLSGHVQSAFAAVRPPGHHARPAQAMGFCLLNNVALAAQLARKRHGLERVAIVDIDVHHGNGTQDAFYDDPGVLYVSTHQFPFYPGTGRMQETGEGVGTGMNVNIPLPGGCGDAEYQAVFEQIVEPVVRRYRPQLILVSCGFDAHYVETIAGMSLSVDGYSELAQRLCSLADELCDGRIVFALEGGYDFDAVAWGARRVIEVLLGDPTTPDPLGPAPTARAPQIGALLADVRRLHKLST